jgi:four helix bundle protein
MSDSVVKDRSYDFALQVIALYRQLAGQNEYVISRQLLKSGTSIGANIEEAMAGQSRADFLAKMSIASKEARETNYWLRLLRDSKLIDTHVLQGLLAESEEIIKMLTSIVKTVKSSIK